MTGIVRQAGWQTRPAGDEIVDDVILIDDTSRDGIHDHAGLIDAWRREHLRTGEAWIGGIRVYDDGRIEHHPDVNPDYLPTIVEEGVITVDNSRFRVVKRDGNTFHLEAITT